MVVSNEKMKKITDDLKTLGIEMRDLHIDTFLPSGKGGMKMQKTHSAVRITYTKLDIQVECQAYREKQTNLYTALCKLYTQAASLLLGHKTPEEKRRDKIRKAKQKKRSRSTKKLKENPNQSPPDSK